MEIFIVTELNVNIIKYLVINGTCCGTFSRNMIVVVSTIIKCLDEK